MELITITYNELIECLENSFTYSKMSESDKKIFMTDFITHNKNKVIVMGVK